MLDFKNVIANALAKASGLNEKELYSFIEVPKEKLSLEPKS